MRVFLDSCVVIYVVEEVRPWFGSVSLAMAEPGIEFLVTQLVRMECRVGPVRTTDEDLDAAFERFFRRYRTMNIRVPAFELATELRAREGLKTADALHVASAISSGCEEFWTNDRRLDRVSLPLTVRVFDDGA